MSKRILVTLVKNHLDCICRFFSRIFFRLGGVVPPPQMILTVNKFSKKAIWFKSCTSLYPTIVQKFKQILAEVLEKSAKNVIFDTNPRSSYDWEFFSALPLFYIYDILHSCKILEKSLECFFIKTITKGRIDGPAEGLIWVITKDPVRQTWGPKGTRPTFFSCHPS